MSQTDNTPRMHNPVEKNSSGKLLWLSIVQGWAILLVVIGHVNGFNYEGDGEMYGPAALIYRFCYSFHMPLFMFVSGGLLYVSRLSRGWTTVPLYIDKLKRLAIPFICFTIVGFCIKGIMNNYAKHPIELNFASFANAFFDPANGPLVEMWFLGTLMWLMFMYPVYRMALRNPLTEIILLVITLLPFLTGVRFEVNGWFNLKGVFDYAFFFVSGILFFKYDLTRVFSRGIWPVVSATVLFAATLLWRDMPLVVTAVPGILMSVGWGILASQRFKGLFGWFRDHSFQIFLVGIFPQMLVELLVWQKFHSELMLLPYYILSCGGALLAGLLLSGIMSRCPVKLLRWGCGLK